MPIFQVGDMVTLIAPHTLHGRGDRVFSESPSGVGSTARITSIDEAASDIYGVRWVDEDGNDQRGSRISGECIALQDDGMPS